MSLLEILQLVGYTTAAALHFWIGALLVKRRHALGKIERLLMLIALSMGVWHGSNLVVALHSMLGLDDGRWTLLLRFVDSLAVVSITLSYSLLLHVHLHLWAEARARELNRTERARVYLSYLPAVFLAYAVPKLWTGAYAPMFVRLAHLLLPFALWAAYSLCLVAATDFLIARRSSRLSEKRLMQTLAASFVGIAAMILVVYALRLGEGTNVGPYLKAVANLGSLVPTALLAYHIYRYRYMELILKESLIVASFAAVVLVVYLYGIRTVGLWLSTYYGLRADSIEAILILLLALVAAPFRRWLDKRFRELFEQEAALFRDVVRRIGATAGRYKQLPELLRFVEERTAEGLGLRRVSLVILEKPRSSDNAGGDAQQRTAQSASGPGGVEAPSESKGGENKGGESKGGAGDGGESVGGMKRAAVAPGGAAEGETFDGDSFKLKDGGHVVEAGGDHGWQWDVLELSREGAWSPVEGEPLLREAGFEIAFPLRREEQEVGLMLVDAAPDALTYDVRAVLEMLAGQVAIAVEDCRLVEQNVQLERRVAHGERLAALGQMAATVAHEVKNPLSAIKSIAQVMREDEYLKREYLRDLDLIVSETDRLSRSVTQMLSFARRAPQDDAPRRAEEVVRALVHLFREEAAGRGVSVLDDIEVAPSELSGAGVAAVRDAMSNLLLNALQATPRGGTVRLEGRAEGSNIILSVIDSGPGVAPAQRERIWEPFFTTRQRGTGLGLAIVRKRIEEVGGRARLAPQRRGEGARFELVVPVSAQAPTA
jgi:signal transduction histidine kinase